MHKAISLGRIFFDRGGRNRKTGNIRDRKSGDRREKPKAYAIKTQTKNRETKGKREKLTIHVYSKMGPKCSD